MWKSFFLAVGLTVVLLGVECLGVERFVFKLQAGQPPAPRALLFGSDQQTAEERSKPAPGPPGACSRPAQ